MASVCGLAICAIDCSHAVLSSSYGIAQPSCSARSSLALLYPLTPVETRIRVSKSVNAPSIITTWDTVMSPASDTRNPSRIAANPAWSLLPRLSNVGGTYRVNSVALS